MNKRNYQKELDALITAMKDGERKSLLLHACCAPCSSYCIEYLSKYFDITILYYNPNISPADEYNKRALEAKRLVCEMEDKGVFDKGRVKVVVLPYEPEVFEKMARGLEDVPEGGSRCYSCYEMRLSKSAEYAAANSFDYFTTTLSISPLKNPEWINEIGERLGDKFGVCHLPSEFRKRGGYQRSIELSREYNLYRQNYCGCVYSKNAV